jgi:hypothetical protein
MWCMYLGAVSLRLDFLHYEEACVQKSFNAVDQAGLFTPREPRRGRAGDASGQKKSAKVNMGNGQEVRRTHLSQHILVKVWIDCWTRACACSRSRKVWSSFCSGVNKSVSIRIPSKKNDGNSALTCVASSKRSAMAGRGRNLARKYCLLAGALFQSASGLRSERIRKLSFVSRYFPFLGAS